MTNDDDNNDGNNDNDNANDNANNNNSNNNNKSGNNKKKNNGTVQSIVVPMSEFLEGLNGGNGDDDDDDDDMYAASSSSAAADAENERSLESLLSFDLKPKEVVDYLDRFVISQEDAKRVLAVAICDHYNHCRRTLLQEQEEQYKMMTRKQQNTNTTTYNKEDIADLLEALDDSSSSSSSYSFDYAKPNVLLAGPTGVGKTYLLKTLARLVGVPFVKADATKFSETGIVGRDAEDLVRDLVDKANGNTTLASVGIIYLDEVDKIAGGGGGDGDGSSTRGGFNTKGVQNNFLKLLEETDVSLDKGGGMQIISNLPDFLGGGQQEDNKPKSISTKNILFIFSGAFTQLDKELRNKKEKKPFGLDLTQTSSKSGPAAATAASTSPAAATLGMDTHKSAKEKPGKSYLRYAETSDFIRTGLEPEFVGRVPVRVGLDGLDAQDLKQILKGAEGSVLKQFVRDMEGYGINMTVTDTALTEIAVRAEKEETGARGLVTILERTLRQHKYELPSTSITDFVLDQGTVIDPERNLQHLISRTTMDDDMGVLLRDLKRWEKKLNSQLPPLVDAYLTDDAINYLVVQALEQQISAYSYTTRHFGSMTSARSSSDGGEADANKSVLAVVIQRVYEATSQKLFPITLELVQNPKKELQKWMEVL